MRFLIRAALLLISLTLFAACGGGGGGGADTGGTSGFALNPLDHYLQVRSFEDGTYKYIGWVGMTKDGAPVTSGDVTAMALETAGGTPITGGVLSYYDGVGTRGSNYDAATTTITLNAPMSYAGSILNFPVGAPVIPAGNYRWRVTFNGGTVKTLDFYYPGDMVLPTPLASSLATTQYPNGDVRFYWSNPYPSKPVRLMMIDGNGKALVNTKLPSTVTTVLLRASDLALVNAANTTGTLSWRVATNYYDLTGNVPINGNTSMNYARGYSNAVPFGGANYNKPRIEKNFLQYRNRESGLKNLVGWVSLMRGTEFVQASEIANVELIDSQNYNYSLTMSPTDYQTEHEAGINPTTGIINLPPSAPMLGMLATLDSPTFGAGAAMWKVTLTDSTVATVNFFYPNMVELPYVESSTMNAVTNGDGSITFTWTNPVGSYDSLRLDVYDANDILLMNVSMPVTQNFAILQPGALATLNAEKTAPQLKWRVETNLRDTSVNVTLNGQGNFNYARGYSLFQNF